MNEMTWFRLSRPVFKHWSEVPLSIGLVLFACFLACYCFNCIAIMEHMGGMLDALRITVWGD